MFDEKAAILDWQENRNPVAFANLVTRYQPVVNSVVNKYRTVGVAPETLKAHATTQFIKALDSYNPNKDTQPVTHIWNNLQKVQRVASESLQSGHLPEARNMRKSMFVTVKDNLMERLGREPNTDELADELAWDKNEVGRMLKELGGEITASGASFDFYGNATTVPNKQRELADYLYQDLEGRDKVVFEHTFGYGGKDVLNNKEIAKKLGINEMDVHRRKKKMSERIREML